MKFNIPSVKFYCRQKVRNYNKQFYEKEFFQMNFKKLGNLYYQKMYSSISYFKNKLFIIKQYNLSYTLRKNINSHKKGK